MQTGIERNIGEIDLKGIIEDALSKARDSHPSRRMGASSLGSPCEREIYLKFRWAAHELNDNVSNMRFIIGDIVEEKVIDALRLAGMVIEYTGKDQIELDIAPHVVCYPDGLVRSGVPGAEKTEHNLEVKSMNSRDFKTLQKKGVKDTKPRHYSQMQLEMYGLSKKLGRRIERTLYVVVCKNLDKFEIYCERVRYDEAEKDRLLDKAEHIRTANELPNGVSTSPSWEGCRMCNFSHFCHVSHESLMVNCRTCCHSTPKEDGTWSCRLDEKYKWGIGALDMGMQTNGCRYHTFIPHLVPYPFMEDESTEDACAFQMPDGSIVIDGLGGADSHDLWKIGRPQPVDSEGNPIENIPF